MADPRNGNKADKTPTMGPTIPGTSGRQTFKANYGQELYVDYALDRSSLDGTKDMERIADSSFNGGVDDISHSIRGAGSAQQVEDKHGSKSKMSEP